MSHFAVSEFRETPGAPGGPDSIWWLTAGSIAIQFRNQVSKAFFDSNKDSINWKISCLLGFNIFCPSFKNASWKEIKDREQFYLPRTKTSVASEVRSFKQRAAQCTIKALDWIHVSGGWVRNHLSSLKAVWFIYLYIYHLSPLAPVCDPEELSILNATLVLKIHHSPMPFFACTLGQKSFIVISMKYENENYHLACLQIVEIRSQQLVAAHSNIRCCVDSICDITADFLTPPMTNIWRQCEASHFFFF